MSTGKIIKLGHFTPHTKMDSKWIKNLNFLEENLRVIFMNLGTTEPLDMTLRQKKKNKKRID